MSSFNPEHNPYIERIKDHAHVEDNLDAILFSVKNKRCIVDLGCGNGHFLQEYLEQNPDLVGLGVERRYKRVFKTAEKIKRIETPLSRVIQFDVPEFLKRSPNSYWDEVWLQFPDPWPKLRHEKNRMVNFSTFHLIYSILKPGGRFCFRSDCRAYWEFLQMANIRSELFPILRSQAGDLFHESPTTLFQRKFMQISTPIYSLEFRK
ncbi:MAG: trmB [Bacteriovoracaceae bacterium]|nr:trmB [Bacteriovoracaceae bacterium]